MNHKQWWRWERNNEYTNKSDDQLKSNMEWSHINNECNDGNDNDLESLGEGYSSHSQRNMTKWIQRKKDLGMLIYELSTTNILCKMTLRYQYTRSMMENTMHIHTCAYFSFLFIIFFFYIYPNTHTLNINKWTPKMISIKNKHTLKCNKNSLWRDELLKLRISKSVSVW